jgi:hypothetical protein
LKWRKFGGKIVQKQANSNVGVLEGVEPEAEPEISVPDMGHFPVGLGSVGLWLKNDLFFIANTSIPPAMPGVRLAG